MYHVQASTWQTYSKNTFKILSQDTAFASCVLGQAAMVQGAKRYDKPYQLFEVEAI